MRNLTAYVEDIRRLVSVREAMELYGYEVSSKGFTLCPFHSEKTPSFKVYTNSFYCFGCGKSGDVITLVRDLFELSFTEAVKRLNSDFSLNLPVEERMSLRQAQQYERQKRELEQARQRERERKQNIEREYHYLIDEYIRLEHNFKQFRPHNEGEVLHPLFIEACHKIEFVTYQLDSFNPEGGTAA